MRKVLEVMPELHERVSDVAHDKRIKMSVLSSVLIAYALENLERAIADADRLLAEAEQIELRRPELRVIFRRSTEASPKE